MGRATEWMLQAYVQESGGPMKGDLVVKIDRWYVLRETNRIRQVSK
jgi:hypothetical protein